MTLPQQQTPPTIGSSRLSLSMIVKNEEQYLAGCLDSVQGIVDEIVIVDTGSTDATLAVAERYGARVFSCPWTNDFAAARNESLAHCSGEWVLYLDADERIAPAQENRFKELFRNRKIGAYTLCLRSDHFLPTGKVTQVNAYPRLFRRLHGVKFEGMVHEQIQPSIEKAGLRVVDSGIYIDHLGYGESLQKVREKCRRNAAILRHELSINPDNAYARFMLGNTLTLLEEHDLARPELELALKSQKLATSIRGNLHLLLAEAAMRKGALQEAEEHCRRSIIVAPRQVMGRWFLSGITMEQKRFEEALKILTEVVSIESAVAPTQLAADMSAPPDELSTRLRMCYESLTVSAMVRGEYDEVARLSRESKVSGIHSIEVTKHSLQAALEVKDVEAAIERVAELLDLIPREQTRVRQKLEAIALRLSGGVPADTVARK